MTSNLSTSRKRMFTIILISVFCLIMVTGLGNYRAKQLAVEMAENQVNKALELAVLKLDLKEVDHIKQDLKQSPAYLEMKKNFTTLKEEHNLANIYIITQDEQANWFYIVEGREPENSASENPGRIETLVPGGVVKVFNGREVQGLYHETAEGTMVSSYIALKNEDGIFAVLGADFAADEFSDFIYTTRYIQIGLIVLALLLIGITLRLTEKTTKE
ncbi:MAG: hypothetical protein ACOX7U_06840 [Desulfitobacteriia bacterium]|jgi:hypothetical protein